MKPGRGALQHADLGHQGAAAAQWWRPASRCGRQGWSRWSRGPGPPRRRCRRPRSWPRSRGRRAAGRVRTVPMAQVAPLLAETKNWARAMRAPSCDPTPTISAPSLATWPSVWLMPRPLAATVNWPPARVAGANPSAAGAALGRGAAAVDVGDHDRSDAEHDHGRDQHRPAQRQPAEFEGGEELLEPGGFGGLGHERADQAGPLGAEGVRAGRPGRAAGPGAAASNSKPGLDRRARLRYGGGPGCGPLVVGVYLNRRGWSPASRHSGWACPGRPGRGRSGAAGRTGSSGRRIRSRGQTPSRDPRPGTARPARPREPGGPGGLWGPGRRGGGAAGVRPAVPGGPQVREDPRRRRP